MKNSKIEAPVSFADISNARKELRTSQITSRLANLRTSTTLTTLGVNLVAIGVERGVSALFYSAPNDLSIRDLFALGAGLVCSVAINRHLVQRSMRRLLKANATINDPSFKSTVDVLIKGKGLLRSSHVFSVLNSFQMSMLVTGVSVAQKIYSGGLHIEGLHPDGVAGGTALLVITAVSAWRTGFLTNVAAAKNHGEAANWISYYAGAFDGDPRDRQAMMQFEQELKQRRRTTPPQPK